MAKDPAFLFYPGDWLGGTMTFNRSHKGAYMDLLMCQYNSGHMSIDDIRIVLGTDFESMWEQKLKSKFQIDPAGKYYNEKLENEINKRKIFTQSRRKNLSSSKNNTPHMEYHMKHHMENENENENVNEIGKEKGVQGEKQNALFGKQKDITYQISDSNALEKELTNNYSQHEALCVSAKNEHNIDINTDEVIKFIPTFIQHLKDLSKFPIEEQDAKSFFGNWFKKRVKDHANKINSNNNRTGKSNGSSISQSYRDKLLADIQSGCIEAATKEAM